MDKMVQEEAKMVFLYLMDPMEAIFQMVVLILWLVMDKMEQITAQMDKMVSMVKTVMDKMEVGRMVSMDKMEVDKMGLMEVLEVAIMALVLEVVSMAKMEELMVDKILEKFSKVAKMKMLQVLLEIMEVSLAKMEASLVAIMANKVDPMDQTMPFISKN